MFLEHVSILCAMCVHCLAQNVFTLPLLIIRGHCTLERQFRIQDVDDRSKRVIERERERERECGRRWWQRTSQACALCCCETVVAFMFL
uniref:Putative secreted protein n=1 Tax=Anopheles marajoara TaxID=58244 RepID=A0A2M4CA26_9DIPT